MSHAAEPPAPLSILVNATGQESCFVAAETPAHRAGSKPDCKTSESIQQDGEQRIAALAAIIEIVAAINDVTDFEQAAQIAADLAGKWLDASRCELLWQDAANQPCQIRAAWGRPNREIHRLDQLRQAAADEILTRHVNVADSHATKTRDQVCLLAVKNFAHETGVKRVLGVALSTPVGQADCELDQLGEAHCRNGGVLLFQFDQLLSEGDVETKIRNLSASSNPLGRALAYAKRTSPNRLVRWLRGMQDPNRHRRRQWIVVVTLIVLGVMMIPLPYRAQVDCELTPVDRRYVTAPFAGPIKEVHLGPGDHVKSGQLMALLDQRELEMELTAKHAELARIKQEQKGRVAQHQIAESRIAALQAERLQSEIELLEYRKHRLKITAPVDGVVVSGDWDRRKGTIIELGEAMFEIAPSDDYLVEVLIEQGDVQLVQPGMQLRFRLDAIPGAVLLADLKRIHPQAEQRDDDSYFIGEAVIHDDIGYLRPGMRGSGTVKTDRHPIAWNLFHRAYYRLLCLLNL